MSTRHVNQTNPKTSILQVPSYTLPSQVEGPASRWACRPPTSSTEDTTRVARPPITGGWALSLRRRLPPPPPRNGPATLPLSMSEGERSERGLPGAKRPSLDTYGHNCIRRRYQRSIYGTLALASCSITSDEDGHWSPRFQLGGRP